MNFLNTNEKLELEKAMKKAKDLSEWKRLFVIIGYDNGKSVEELAELMLVSTFTVDNYLKDYASKNKTKNDPRGGGQSKLAPEDAQKLEKHLMERTYLKIKDIIAYVKMQFNKTYSRSGMTAWLQDQGFIFKCPKQIPGKLNPEAQAKFIEEYKTLKESLGKNEQIYFMDAVHPEYQSKAVCGWIKKGECKTLQTTGKQLRLHFAGALCLENMHFIVNEYKSVNSDAIIAFLKKVETESSAEIIHIILDNARAQKNKLLDEYLKESRIKLHYLPPYSPNLNSIERLWKILREATAYNRYYPSCKEFFYAVTNFLMNKVPNMLSDLKLRITDNFQVITPNPIHVN